VFGDVSRPITGEAIPIADGGYPILIAGSTGAITHINSGTKVMYRTEGFNISTAGIRIDTARVIPTGPENASITASERWMRRVA